MPWHPPAGPLRVHPAISVFLLATLATSASVASDAATAAFLVVAEILAVFGACAEVALERHSRSRVLAMAEEAGRGPRIARLMHNVPSFELVARLVRFVGHALLVTGIAFLSFRNHLPDAEEPGALPWGLFGLVLAILFVLTFLINGVIVRILIARRPNQTLVAVLPYLQVLKWVTAPLRRPLVLLVRLIFRVDLDAAAPSAREEILETVVEGEREGSFTAEEAEMIGSIIEMETSLAKDVLTPRADMVMIQADASLHEAVVLVRREGYSRVPVYGTDRDDVIGVLYAHDLLAHWTPGPTPEAGEVTVRDLMREPFFVPENKSLNELLKEMRARKVHLAVVLDEFNGTEGLVTIEDLLEEIVGDIEDEYDEDAVGHPHATAEELEAGIFRVPGRASLEEINARYGTSLPIEDDFETLGGLVFHRLGKVPEPGQTVALENVIITVVEADERRARSLLLKVLPREPVDADTRGA